MSDQMITVEYIGEHGETIVETLDQSDVLMLIRENEVTAASKMRELSMAAERDSLNTEIDQLRCKYGDEVLDLQVQNAELREQLAIVVDAMTEAAKDVYQEEYDHRVYADRRWIAWHRLTEAIAKIKEEEE